jgi:glycosyltransferase involved in cell wall biosynthesis
LNIAFDTWPLNARFRNSGIYLYTLTLLKEFAQLSSEQANLQVTAFTGMDLQHDTECIPTHRRLSIIQTPALDHSRMWRLLGLFREAKKARTDVIFVPHAQVVPNLTSQPVVCTIHDVTPVRTPWQMDRRITLMLKTYLRFAARNATGIVTVSEASKRDIVEIYGADPGTIRVTYPGHDRSIFNQTEPDQQQLSVLKNRCGLRGAYLYHHGAVQPRKNLETLIRAHHLLLERDPSLELDLVLAGPLGWLFEPTVALGRKLSTARGRVVFTGALPDSEIALLLKGASLGVFPSLYEGFCMPMVESMACGVPTVASNVSCLPEVSGGVLRYFDPTSPEDMANVIHQVLTDSDERQRIIAAGLQRASQFSWRSTAEQTLEVLSSAAEGR